MLNSSRLDQVINNAMEWSFREQHPDGKWVGMLECNSCMEAHWIFTMHFLGVLEDEPKKDEIVRCIRSLQRVDGSWEMYYGAPEGDINPTIECYVALKTAGVQADEQTMVAARKWIFNHGGVPASRVFTKIWLALLGELSWDDVPTLPPELIFLPHYIPFNLYNFSSWARQMIVPLSILSARRAVRPLPLSSSCHELHSSEGIPSPMVAYHSVTTRIVRKLFYYADKLLLWYGKSRFIMKPGRETAIKCCLAWILKRQQPEGSWFGIIPPWYYSLMALHWEGYPIDHPVVRSGIRAFDHPWAHKTDQGTFIQPSTSVIWDTLLMQTALLDCGLDSNHPKFEKSLQYILLKQETTIVGDWSVKVPNANPGGWYFQYQNSFYPDVDDTAVAMTLLGRIVIARTSTNSSHDTHNGESLDNGLIKRKNEECASEGINPRILIALDRALQWILAMVSKNGAWAAFDKDNTSILTCMIPFCDYGEILDPPSVDVTAHVLQALGTLGHRLKDDPKVATAVAWVRKEQEEGGSWFGRWGVNHIYGVGAVLPALHSIGEDMDAPYIRKAVLWLVGHQNNDGGWGESCASYVDPNLRGKGPSTPSQTSWALLALLAAQPNEGVGPEFESIKRGVEYLVQTQTFEGSWEEEYFTGCGFPGFIGGARIALMNQGKELGRGLMLRYHMYRHYFPLMALGQARQYFHDLGITFPTSTL